MAIMRKAAQLKEPPHFRNRRFLIGRFDVPNSPEAVFLPASTGISSDSGPGALLIRRPPCIES